VSLAVVWLLWLSKEELFAPIFHAAAADRPKLQLFILHCNLYAVGQGKRLLPLVLGEVSNFDRKRGCMNVLTRLAHFAIFRVSCRPCGPDIQEMKQK